MSLRRPFPWSGEKPPWDVVAVMSSEHALWSVTLHDGTIVSFATWGQKMDWLEALQASGRRRERALQRAGL